ncbi:RNA polymerase sigma factor SigF [Dactylosporangium sp. NPDC049742]|uniref:RNA polymerase sigma factor SigF n=1 Tax=Dactylosporangium sp. NPDC049742 TaxID=3154737 RepID=UPI0034187186
MTTTTHANTAHAGTARVAAPVDTEPTAAAHSRAADRAETNAVALSLLSLLADLPSGNPDRPRIRARIIELYLPLARYLAQRFRNHGEPFDDLVQVANMGLIKSVDGFDPSRGIGFTAYAIPTISGELKRHFRDRCWDLRIPRRTQEIRLRISRVTEELTQILGRSPTVADLADRLGCTEEDVIEGLDAAHAYRTLSLDAPAGSNGDGEHTDLGALVGGADRGLEQVDAREALKPLLAALPDRERIIITMRFFDDCSQSRIAAELGISQMHVSRLLRATLETLRRHLLAG